MPIRRLWRCQEIENISLSLAQGSSHGGNACYEFFPDLAFGETSPLATRG